MMIATVTTYRKKTDMTTKRTLTNAERAGKRWHAEDIASGLHRCLPTCPLFEAESRYPRQPMKGLPHSMTETPTTTVDRDGLATKLGA